MGRAHGSALLFFEQKRFKDEMNFWKRLDKTERRLVAVSVIVLALSLCLLQFDDFFGRDGFSSKPLIGRIAYKENDTRYKSVESFVWYKARNEQGVHIGDAVFTGEESNARVDLKKGGNVTVGQNSMIVFSEIDSEKLANLQYGNFGLKVEGSIKVAIQGEVTTIEGKGSEIQVFTGRDKKPKLRLLKGSATIQSKGKQPVKLERGDITNLVPQKQVRELARASLPPPAISVPHPEPTSEVIPYIWKLYDLYARTEMLLAERAAPPELVETLVKINWRTHRPDKKPKTDSVELSQVPDMETPTRFDSNSGSMEFTQVYLGNNFWRVSSDGKNWSEIQRFEVRPQFLPGMRPEIVSFASRFPLVGPSASISVDLKVPFEPLGFVAEASTSETFEKGSTRSFWAPTTRLRLSFYKPGRYFYRFRAVTKSQELTEWSEIHPVVVEVPALLPGVKLAKRTYMGYLGDEFNVQWSAVEGARQYRTIVTNSAGDKIPTLLSRAPKLVFKPKHTDVFKVAVQAVDEYGRLGKQSDFATIRVVEKPKPAPIIQSQKPRVENTREPSSAQATSAIKMEQKSSSLLNDRFKHSKLALEGAAWTLQSTEQAYSNRESPIATGVGIRAQHWWNRSGVEASFKTGVFGVNSSGSGLSQKQTELRYHYRFFTGFPWRLARELQISVFGGYELYRSSGGGSFSPQYDLVKFGTSLEFPLWNRWTTGGEILYGQGSDESKKQEISGHLNYYLTRDWSFGAGYRLHLFEAGSLRSSGAGYLPFREGYTELYSTLLFHY